MLQVGTEPFGLQPRPEEVLGHGAGLGGKVRHLVLVHGELLLHGAGAGGVVKEHDGAGGGAEHGHAVGRVLPLVLGDNLLEGVAGQVPEAVVLGAKEHDGPRGLRVEARGGVQDGVVDHVGDARGGHARGQVLGEGVVGAPVLGELEEQVGGELGGGHFVFWFGLVGLVGL